MLINSTMTLNDTEMNFTSVNCSAPSILDFPHDLFTQHERLEGAVVVHFIASIYIFYALAIVCDEYFVPSIEAICRELKVPSDVGGATFMAIATSSPELFTNCIGTFITKGDLGVGTIVGSALFNILAVCACCGFTAKKPLALDWYPFARDSLVYLVAVILLVGFLQDERIYFYEALILLLVYIFYIALMWKNKSLKNIIGRCMRQVQETTSSTSNLWNFRADYLPEEEVTPAEEEDGVDLFTWPKGQSVGGWLNWLMGWPARFVFYLTIPDCKSNRFRKWYVMTLMICIVYLGLLTYVVSWMITVIGHTFMAPDSVMGLTFIAAGNSPNTSVIGQTFQRAPQKKLLNIF